jgi:hypothetical protein
MINPDHSCWWTRRRVSQLSRREGQLAGAGLSRSVLEATAEKLGYPLATTPRPDEEYDEEVTLGPWRGNIHDGCFVSFESDDARLLEALLAASLELHAFYLGASVKPGCVTQLQHRLMDGMTLRLRSLPRERHLIAKSYRIDAGWWERLATPGDRVCE